MGSTPTRIDRAPWYAKKAYSSRTIQVGGTAVTLMQPTFTTDRGLIDADTKIRYMVEDARSVLSRAVLIPDANRISPLLGELFNPENKMDFSPSMAWGTIKPKLIKIQKNLAAPHSIKVVGTLDTGGMGSVKFYNDGTGDIHLAKRLFEAGLRGNATLTYLHEASHKYAGTVDHAYWKKLTGVWRDNRIHWCYDPKITNDQALNNADSFAFLLYHLPGPNWRY